MGAKPVVNAINSDPGPLGVVDVFLARFEAFLRHFDTLRVPETSKLSRFRTNKGVNSGPNTLFRLCAGAN